MKKYFDFNYDTFIKRQEIRKNRKIWFWLFLLPPVGVYKAHKYKAFSVVSFLLIYLLFTTVVVTSLDTVLNPNRVLDTKMKQVVEDFEDIGELRSYVRQNDLDDNFLVYNAVTTNGIYDIYFRGDGSLEVEGINQMYPTNETIYMSDNIPNKYKDLAPQVVRFFCDDENIDKFGEIISHSNRDTHSQIITTDKDEYLFEFKNGEVISVSTENSEVLNRDITIKLPDDMYKAILKNKDIVGTLKEVQSLNITNNVIEYFFINEDDEHFKITKYLNNTIEIFKKD